MSTSNVRYRDDASAASVSASSGVPVNAGEILNYDGKLSQLQFCAQSGTATLDILYYG